jgi:hypothetical protein
MKVAQDAIWRYLASWKPKLETRNPKLETTFKGGKYALG